MNQADLQLVEEYEQRALRYEDRSCTACGGDGGVTYKEPFPMHFKCGACNGHGLLHWQVAVLLGESKFKEAGALLPRDKTVITQRDQNTGVIRGWVADGY